MSNLDEYEEQWRREHPCPKCGGPTYWEPDCPGYGTRKPDGTGVMVCYPYCGNAEYYSCLDDACGWWLRDPNRRSETEWNFTQKRDIEMGPRPAWELISEKHAEDFADEQ